VFISEIRENFLRTLPSNEGEITQWTNPEKGPGQKSLNTQVWLRRGDPNRLLVSISGVHGAEAFIGSRIQQRILQERQSLQSENSPTLLFIHNFNCFGSAWVRRVNHQNIDLNRNSWIEKPQNPHFNRYRSWLSAQNSWQFWSGFARGLPDIALRGPREIGDRISRGQADFHDALFFAGSERAFETRQLQEFLRKQFPQTPEKIFVLDLHTGLGKYGQESLIVDPAIDDLLRSDLGVLFQSRLVIPQQENGFSQAVGSLGYLFKQIFPTASLCYLTQEFGTFHPLQVLKQLALENSRWHSQGPTASGRTELLLETFYPSRKSWQDEVLRLGVHRFRLLHDFI